MYLINQIGTSVLMGTLLLLVYTISKLRSIYKSSRPKTVGLFGIWLLGLMTFLTGVLHQLINIRDSFDDIEQMGEINTSIVSSLISDSYKTTISGLIVFIFSLVLWGIVKTLRDNRSNLN